VRNKEFIYISQYAGSQIICNRTTDLTWQQYEQNKVTDVPTRTLKISPQTQARSCIMSFMETPKEASSLHSSAMPPGRSLTVTWNLTSRCSAARPRSKHRPRIVVSMLPPDSMHTTLEFTCSIICLPRPLTLYSQRGSRDPTFYQND
jgi:hypothetical protein